MSKPIIEHFDFGKSSGVSLSQREKESSLPPDNLILVDAFWEKDGMKIRFIPHQMGGIKLIVVFVFEYNNPGHDKDKANFELTFESPDTVFSKQQSIKIIIKGKDVLNNKLIGKDNKQVKEDNRPCYYFIIEDFSSDLSNIKSF